jgi:O-succinylbenzoate synthase
VRVTDGDGVEGWGECTADEDPFYSEEWTESAWGVIRSYLAPMTLGREIEGAAQVFDLMRRVRGHNMAKAAVETAVWDLEAKRLGLPLWRHLGGARPEIQCGVSVGIQETLPALFGSIERELAAGYRRVKIKIRPGWDVGVVEAVRARFPNLPLMVDANGAYTLADAHLFRALDALGLMMIERPLAHDDIGGHARLQRQLKTPICLDESATSRACVRLALDIRAYRVVNVKLGRVGGHGEARAVERACRERGVAVWCGGMLEAGVGRAHNVALSTLEGFTLPGDVSASARYWEEDIIEPPVTVTPQGTVKVRRQPGIGYEANRRRIDSLTARKESLTAP